VSDMGEIFNAKALQRLRWTTYGMEDDDNGVYANADRAEGRIAALRAEHAAEIAGLREEVARVRDAAVTEVHRSWAAERVEWQAQLLACAEHFKTLREAGVFVWPNHPLNPEKRIQAIIDGSEGK
jgi:hypothetical protein